MANKQILKQYQALLKGAEEPDMLAIAEVTQALNDIMTDTQRDALNAFFVSPAALDPEAIRTRLLSIIDESLPPVGNN